MIITFNYYDKINDTLVKQNKIKNCTLKYIEEILLVIYPNKQHIVEDKKETSFFN
jgi:hypothetical protein